MHTTVLIQCQLYQLQSYNIIPFSVQLSAIKHASNQMFIPWISAFTG